MSDEILKDARSGKPWRIITRKTDTKNRYTNGIKPMTRQQWISLGDDLKEWVSDETKFDIDEFPLLKGYSPHKFKKWDSEDDYFRECLEIALYTISVRRERAARFREQDGSVIMRTHPLYNKDYREWREVELQKTNELNRGLLTVVLEPAPSSPLVEEKKKSHPVVEEKKKNEDEKKRKEKT